MSTQSILMIIVIVTFFSYNYRCYGVENISAPSRPPPPRPPPPPPPLAPAPSPSPPPRPPKWNHILAVMYGVGICAKKTCAAKLTVESFTIHGLWPNSLDSPTSKPVKPTNTKLLDCLPFSPLVAENVTLIKDQLDSLWPNILNPGQEIKFWNHEWKKHGTCFHDPPETLPYFTTTLCKFKELNANELLKEFPPDDTKEYKVADLHNKLKGKEPYVLCGASPGSKDVVILKELQFCLDATATIFVDCSTFYSAKDLTNCKDGKFKILELEVKELLNQGLPHLFDDVGMPQFLF